MDKKKIKGMIGRLFLSLVVMAFIVALGYLIMDELGYTNISKEEIRDLIRETKAWGPICYIFISFLQVTFIPIPGAVTILGGNLLFGPWLASLYSFIGIMIGSIVAFGLGRLLGRPFVNWVVGDKETVEKYLDKMKGKETVVLFFMFLLPIFPDDALCTLAGITPIKKPLFILMQLITRPISILGTILFMSGEIIPLRGWGLVLIFSVVIVSLICFFWAYRKADLINEKLNNLFQKKP